MRQFSHGSKNESISSLSSFSLAQLHIVLGNVNNKMNSERRKKTLNFLSILIYGHLPVVVSEEH